MGTLAISHALSGNGETAEKYLQQRTLIKSDDAILIRGVLNLIYAGEFNTADLPGV